MTEPISQPFDIREFFWRLRRYSWLLALPPVVALCIASVYYKISPVVYQAHVSVSLGDQANLTPAIQGLVNPDLERGNSRDRMNIVDTRVRSRAFLDAAAERLGLLSSPAIQAAAQAAAQRYPTVPASDFASRLAGASISQRIKVLPTEEGLVRITASGGTAEGAQRLAATITDLLIEWSRRSSLERVQARGEFSQDQVLVYRERLRDSEDAYQRYQEALLKRVVSNTPINQDNVEAAYGVVRTTDQEIEQTRDRLEAARIQWRQYAPDASPPILASRASDEMERRLLSQEVSLAAAATGGTRSAGEAQALQANIAATRLALLGEFESLAAGLSGEFPDDARAVAAGLATDRAILRSLQKKRERWAGYIKQFERGVENSPGEQMELSRLRTAVESNRELLNALQRESQSTRISEAFASSAIGPRVSVVDPPMLPLRPASPDPIRIFGAALLLGPLLSIGIVIGAEKIAIVIRTVDQAEKELGSRVLGTVPRIEGWTHREGYLARHWAVLSIVLVVVLTGLFHGLNATLHSDQRPRTEATPTAP